ncbi:Holliday junction branch migration protein RuvA [Clostridium botulinum]|uniref:Holliday junction branch migration complex subunit RuvA n=1 Tax=Clostridium botulinum TaxID=1491 RepID=A0A6G4HWN5_CLOBO|nr:Holliday junction branch migration protein RuvA [Clostridium botulinum]MBD5588398.1 Holliday junction branch migration protein RuvA [Clostridium botulinum]MBO0570447.1 Holliday junction branch migration protein RuvA [Clostridium botulinum]MBO0581096.1 Holliday junction branch migration protein RuvA [Clostridium botulinum]MBY6951654.1 Holliday junction branch migration protein RuvA [Clostridium botulinum]MCR1137312.1 Holliday junction branch migration protein RuvA [Clostridium botulinum]
MYEYIKGKYIDMYKDYIVIENNNIGYKIYTSGSTMAKLPSIGENIMLYTEQIVREDFIGVYGFLTKDELSMFKLLLTINGVGAKASLSLLSISNVSTLKYAIKMGDEKTITRAPGIGKKTAQRIILELKDKIEIDILEEDDEQIINKVADDKKVLEAVAALVTLGYSEKEANKVINSCDKNNSLEQIIKEALKYLMK